MSVAIISPLDSSGRVLVSGSGGGGGGDVSITSPLYSGSVLVHVDNQLTTLPVSITSYPTTAQPVTLPSTQRVVLASTDVTLPVQFPVTPAVSLATGTNPVHVDNFPSSSTIVPADNRTYTVMPVSQTLMQAFDNVNWPYVGHMYNCTLFRTPSTFTGGAYIINQDVTIPPYIMPHYTVNNNAMFACEMVVTLAANYLYNTQTPPAVSVIVVLHSDMITEPVPTAGSQFCSAVPTTYYADKVFCATVHTRQLPLTATVFASPATSLLYSMDDKFTFLLGGSYNSADSIKFHIYLVAMQATGVDLQNQAATINFMTRLIAVNSV